MCKRILAIDSATEACSVAIWNEGEIIELFEICPRNHTHRILPMVQQILSESGFSLNQLDALAFGCGPGSFTGIRIGIGIGQGLALGADLPMIGVSTLQTLAQGAWRKIRARQVLAVLDARMGEIYLGQFKYKSEGQWSSTHTEVVVTPQKALMRIKLLQGSWVSVGTSLKYYPDLISGSEGLDLSDGNLSLPRAEDMLPLALALWNRGKAVPVEQAKPTYLRHEVV